MNILLLLLSLLPLSSLAAYDWRCNLFCYHGGECRHGKGKFGSYAGVDETDLLPWERTTEAGGTIGMYCGCPAGYTGLQCEIAMKVCGNDEHTCFNGAACVKETDMEGKLWWRCECDVAQSKMDASYAGKYCEHVATTFCNKGNGDFGYEQKSFCTNGGKCKKKDHEGQKSVGCICLEGYEGQHCEINTIKPSMTMSDMAVAATSNTSVGMIVGIVLSVVFCITGILYFRDRKQKKKIRRRRRMDNARIGTTDGFRADTEMVAA